MTIVNRFKKAIVSFLRLDPADRQSVQIKQSMDFLTTAFRNRLWYHGDAYELNQFYSQISGEGTMPFWGSVSTSGLDVRKIHTGLPRIIVDTLTNIVIRDLNDFTYDDIVKKELWNRTEAENNVKRLLKTALRDALIVGDGAFKISIHPDVSQAPIVEWYPQERVRFRYDHGRIKEVVFENEYVVNHQKYILSEHYGFGYVTYELADTNGTPQNLNDVPELAGLEDVSFDKSLMLAVPFILNESDRFKGRGRSVFEGKCDNFDSLDECYSQWVHAMRESRPTKYIPLSFIPRNEQNGTLLKPNPFDNQFVQIDSPAKEGQMDKIELVQPVFPSEAYLQTYVTALDLCLQGIISPSTLGIDTKKLDNAEAQREKEKTTLYTRNGIIEVFSAVIKKLVEAVLNAENTLNQKPLEKTNVDVNFGEYANPSFEAVVETLSNPNTPMSIEAKVDEMWGDSKDSDWKAEEVRRIKEQSGIVEESTPQVGFGGIV